MIGCVISPLLFILVIKMILNSAEDNILNEKKKYCPNKKGFYG